MSTIHVTGLNPATTQATLQHFFSFCGKIESIEHDTPAPTAAAGSAAPTTASTSAIIKFAKPSAGKTALMLSGGVLDDFTIGVGSTEQEAVAHLSSAETPVGQESHEELGQEDKPHSAIAAEYLAHGYVLSDAVIERAIKADQQYGISARFLSLFNPLATSAQPHIDNASQKLAEVDEKQGLLLKATAAFTIGKNYYRSALASPFGAKVHSFYTSTSKQVLDVHEEALRIKENKKAASTSTPAAAASTSTSSTAPVTTGTAEKTGL